MAMISDLNIIKYTNITTEYKYNIIVIDKGNGSYTELNRNTQSFTIQTQRLDGAGVLNLEFILNELETPPFEEGATIKVMVNMINIFAGFVFSISRDRWGVCRLTAYDSIRYLKNPVFIFKKAGYDGALIIREVAEQCGVDFVIVGGIAVDYKWASMPYLEYNKPAIDIIMQILNRSVTSGKTEDAFTLQADYETFGKTVMLCKVSDNIQPVVIGEKSLLTNIQISRSIDNDWYNSHLLVYDLGTSDVPKVGRDIRNEASIQRRGMLRKVFEVPQGMYSTIFTHKFGGTEETSKEADEKTRKFIEDLGQKSAQFYNKLVYNVSFDCLGFLGIRAGDMVKINVKGLNITKKDGEALGNLLMLDSVTHQFNEGVHTMSLEGKIDVAEQGMPMIQDMKT